MIVGPNKPKFIWLRYPIKIFFFFIRRPFKNLYIAKLLYNSGDVYSFLSLDRKEKLIKISKNLQFGNNGLENYLKLIEYSLKTR